MQSALVNSQARSFSSGKQTLLGKDVRRTVIVTPKRQCVVPFASFEDEPLLITASQQPLLPPRYVLYLSMCFQ